MAVYRRIKRKNMGQIIKNLTAPLKLYVVRTKTDKNGDGVVEGRLAGVYTSREGADGCVQEIKARNNVQRHNVTTAEAKITVTEILPDTYYENI